MRLSPSDDSLGTHRLAITTVNTNAKNVEIYTEAVGDASEESDDFFSSPLSRRFVRRIDIRSVPLLFITYNFTSMDKTIISIAATFGLKESVVIPITCRKSAVC